MLNQIELFRELNKGKSPKILVDEYYRMFGEIEDAESKKEYNKVLFLCEKSLSLIESLINETKIEYGSFDLKEIPAIEILCFYYAALGNETKLNSLKEVVAYFPELEPWKEMINDSYNMLSIGVMVIAIAHDTPGFLQKDLKRKIELPGIENQLLNELITNVLYYMSKLGRIQRTKVGNSYSLTLI